MPVWIVWRGSTDVDKVLTCFFISGVSGTDPARAAFGGGTGGSDFGGGLRMNADSLLRTGAGAGASSPGVWPDVSLSRLGVTNAPMVSCSGEGGCRPAPESRIGPPWAAGDGIFGPGLDGGSGAGEEGGGGAETSIFGGREEEWLGGDKAGLDISKGGGPDGLLGIIG